MTRTIYLIICCCWLLFGCQQRSNVTPWGSVIGDTTQQTSHLSFDEMLMQGEMILLTLSGPDTYYEYHGRGMGLQYHLCQQFANHLGVSLRADICKDTAELFHRLRIGEGDIAIVQGMQIDEKLLTKDNPTQHPTERGERKVETNTQQSTPSTQQKEERGTRKEVRKIVAKGGITASDIGGTQWFTFTDNEDLRRELQAWYNADCLAFAEQAEKQGHLPQPRSYSFNAPIMNALKGVISQYDAFFQRYAPLSRTDWRLLAAQCYQESHFDPVAQSWAGAKGLMQLMPATAEKLGISGNAIFDPATNIEGGARTMGMLITLFRDIPSPTERLRFALAAYNGGYGHIRDAMKLTKKHGRNATVWNNVAEYVLRLSEPAYFNDPLVNYGYMRGTETVGYVDQVMRRYEIYRGGKVSEGGSRSSSSSSYEDNSTPRRATVSHRYQL